MSTSDVLYLKTDLPPHEVAAEMILRLGGRIQEQREPLGPRVVIPRLAGFSGWAVADLNRNYPLEPWERELTHERVITDGYDVRASVRCYRKDEALQEQAAGIFMRLFVVDGVRWAATLVHEFSWVSAAFDPAQGYRPYAPHEVDLLDSPTALWANRDVTSGD